MILRLNIQKVGKVCEDQIKVRVLSPSLDLVKKDSLLDESEKGFQFHSSLLPHLVESPLFPEVNDNFNLLSEDVAHDSRVNVFLLLQELVSKFLRDFS